MRLLTACCIIAALGATGCSEVTEQPAASPYTIKDIEVTWQRYVKDGNTCTRCDQTGSNMDAAVAELKKELAPHGVKVTAVKKQLDEQQIAESNRVFINGEPIECIVPGVRVFLNDCENCCDMAAKTGVQCRAIEYNGKQYEEVPKELVREAILAIARNLPRPPPPEPAAGAGCSG